MCITLSQGVSGLGASGGGSGGSVGPAGSELLYVCMLPCEGKAQPWGGSWYSKVMYVQDSTPIVSEMLPQGVFMVKYYISEVWLLTILSLENVMPLRDKQSCGEDRAKVLKINEIFLLYQR